MESLGEKGAIPARQFHSPKEGTIDLGDVPLEKGYRVAGRIVLADGKPVGPRTRLIVGRPDAWDTLTIETDAEGRFAIAGVPAEIISISVALKDYEPSPKNKSYDPDGQNSIEGRVTGDVDNLIILCEGRQEKEDDLGAEAQAVRARFRRLRNEPIEGVTAELNAPPVSKTVSISLGERRHPAAARPNKVDLPPALPALPPADAKPAKTIEGLVSDADGKPIAGAEVWLPVPWSDRKEQLFARGRSNDQGQFSLSLPEAWLWADAAERQWVVLAHAAGYKIGGRRRLEAIPRCQGGRASADRAASGYRFRRRGCRSRRATCPGSESPSRADQPAVGLRRAHSDGSGRPFLGH